jgi:hypothetical protein
MNRKEIQELRELADAADTLACDERIPDSDVLLRIMSKALRACADREERARAEDKPTREQLMELFDYDRLSGSLVRKVAQSNRSAGEKVGCLDHEGYLRTVINGRLYRNHHLVWTYWYGMFPTFQIDHINRVKTDNRIENLRAANRELQSQNTSLRLDSKTGYKGVVFHKRMGKYQAQYKMNKVLHHVGYFDTPEDAHEALMKHKKANNHPDAIDHALQSAALALQGDRWQPIETAQMTGDKLADAGELTALAVRFLDVFYGEGQSHKPWTIDDAVRGLVATGLVRSAVHSAQGVGISQATRDYISRELAGNKKWEGKGYTRIEADLKALRELDDALAAHSAQGVGMGGSTSLKSSRTENLWRVEQLQRPTQP